MSFVSLSNGECVNDRFIISVAADDTPSDNGRQWRRVTYQRGRVARIAYCLAEDAENLLAARAAGNADPL